MRTASQAVTVVGDALGLQALVQSDAIEHARYKPSAHGTDVIGDSFITASITYLSLGKRFEGDESEPGTDPIVVIEVIGVLKVSRLVLRVEARDRIERVGPRVSCRRLRGCPSVLVDVPAADRL